MKICYANPTVLMKRPISELAARLPKDKFEISILTPKRLGKDLDNSLHHSTLINQHSIFAYSTVNAPFLKQEQPIPITLVFYLDLFRVWKRNDIVHVWVPFYLSSTLLALTKLLFFRKKRLILTMDTIPAYSFSMGRMDLLFKLYYKTIGKLVFMACDEIALYGESFRPYAKAAGLPKEKIVITPTGVDLPPQKKRTDVRHELGIVKEEKLVLFVGIIGARKGVDILMDAAALLKNERARFVVVGDGPERQLFEREAKERGLNNVLFTGFRRDVHAFYSAADIFFFPSRGEGLPGAVMEAMSHGLPIVASDIAGTRDLISDGKSGFLCPESSAAYRDCLVSLLRHPATGKRLGAAAKRTIRERYSWDANAKTFEELYESHMDHTRRKIRG